MRYKHAKDPEVDRSLTHSIRDGVAYSVMSGAGETYISAFALYLKASTAQIGLLASLPQLIASLAQLFSAWLGHKNFSRRSIILTGCSLQSLTWIPIILLPILFPAQAVTILIICVAAYHMAGNLVIPQWGSLMGDLVPERRRGRFFALRTRYASITVFSSLVIAGIILHLFEQHNMAIAGFICIFIVSAVARFVSIYHLSKMIEPTGKVAAMEIPVSIAWWGRIRHSRFVRFSLFFALMQFSVAIASPYFAVYMLRDLAFSYAEFMAIIAISVLMQFLTLSQWGRISDAFGNRLTLVFTSILIPVLPALWLISHNFWYLICVQLVAGLVWAGFSLSAGNYLYDLLPPPKRSTFMAIHNVMTNTGIFLGAILGAYIGSNMPAVVTILDYKFTSESAFYGVFLASFLARASIAAIFLPHLKEVRTVRPMSIPQLVYRVSRFSAVSGLLYDIVATVTRSEKSSLNRKKRP